MNILLVDDSKVTTMIIGEIIRKKEGDFKLTVLTDGEKAMDFLYQNGPYQHAEPPELIILDLNLPKKNGFEVLSEIKHDKKLKKIKVVMFTSSEQEFDKYNAMKLGATDFFVKPYDYAQYEKIIDRFITVAEKTAKDS
ncbi:MAG: response regulator [Bacteroidota bacterium]|nr:response regulator [Bacteroidota bacterium]MDP4190819.1 response regulator [Bacteroidota bacterium]MDP4196822.1 response regulator [Bacteroidota bacterium]